MTAKNHHLFGNSPDMPDFDSGALAFQTAFVNEISKLQDTPIKVSPQATKEEPSEIARWKRDFGEMREKKVEAEEITEMMAQDLCEIHEQMAKKDDELKRKDEELTKLQRQLEMLTEEPPSSPQMNDALAQTDKRLFEEVSFGALEKMQLRFDTLLKESEETKERMGTQLSQEEDLRRIAEDKLRERSEELEIASAQAQDLRQAEVSEFEAKVQEILSHGDTQIEELQKRASEAEALLRDRMETDENQEQLLQQIGTLEQEVKDQRKRCDYFKKTSERLSTKVKSREATLRASEQQQHRGAIEACQAGTHTWGATKVNASTQIGTGTFSRSTQTWGAMALFNDKAQSSAFTFSYPWPSVTSSSINAGVVPGAFPGESTLV